MIAYGSFLDHSLPLRFGGMVSTSNQFDLENPAGGIKVELKSFERQWHVVDIETDEPIVWTVEVDLGEGLFEL